MAKKKRNNIPYRNMEIVIDGKPIKRYALRRKGRVYVSDTIVGAK